MKKPLVERFQQLANIIPLGEIDMRGQSQTHGHPLPGKNITGDSRKEGQLAALITKSGGRVSGDGSNRMATLPVATMLRMIQQGTNIFTEDLDEAHCYDEDGKPMPEGHCS